MNFKIPFLSIAALAALSLTACKQNTSESNTSTATAMAQTSSQNPKVGDHVPSDLVCMVNNEYMGKEQLVVEVEGKTYYGCCEMCQERLPKDESVRYAVDPQTGEKVDKATAYIVLAGERGEVAYFANEKNYKDFQSMN